MHERLKFIFTHRAAANAENPHTLETALIRQPAQRRHQLASREIAGGAKDHDHARLRMRQSQAVQVELDLVLQLLLT